MPGRLRRRWIGALAAAVLAAGVTGTRPALGARVAGPPNVPKAGVAVRTPRSDPALDGVHVDTDARTHDAEASYSSAVEAEREAQRRLGDAEQARRDLGRRSSTAVVKVEEDRVALVTAQEREASARSDLARLRGVESTRRAAFVAERENLRHLAAAVVAASVTDRYEILTATKDPTAAARREVVKVRSISQQTARVEDRRTLWITARSDRRRQDDSAVAAVEAVVAASDQAASATRARERLDELQRAADVEIGARRRGVEAAAIHTAEALAARRGSRLTAKVSRLDFPLVALDAYWRAAGSAPCPVPWWLIAGVGHAETDHGSEQGSRLDAWGNTSIHILGIVLDGAFPGTAAIPDTDGGRLDNDPLWDLAVGPMQFIPGTWAEWAADGNRDGIADPHNLYDAAAAAAAYLCSGRSALTDELAMRDALFSYNASVPYADLVLAAGTRYRDSAGLPDLPRAASTPVRPAGG